MKKMIMFLFLLCFIFILFGCDSSVEMPDTPTEPETLVEVPDSKDDKVEPLKEISTKANYTFFPTERSTLHQSKLKEAYENYKLVDTWG